MRKKDGPSKIPEILLKQEDLTMRLRKIKLLKYNNILS